MSIIVSYLIQKCPILNDFSIHAGPPSNSPILGAHVTKFKKLFASFPRRNVFWKGLPCPTNPLHASFDLLSCHGLWIHGTCCNARARGVRGFLADPSWFRSGLRALDTGPSELNAGYGINSSRIRLIAIRLNWAGWSEGSPRNINPLPPSHLHRLCYSLFNRLRLVEAAIPAASLLRSNMFRALLGILARMERLPTDLMVYRPFLEGGREGKERDCRWFAFCSMKRLVVV